MNEADSQALANLKKAFSKLEEYQSTPVEDDRDKAGIIQAFEFTYEQFWKMFQKIAHAQGLKANSPLEAFKAAFQMRIIAADEELPWLQMIRDRNSTTHTYKEDVSNEIFQRISCTYSPLFVKALEKIQEMMAI